MFRRVFFRAFSFFFFTITAVQLYPLSDIASENSFSDLMGEGGRQLKQEELCQKDRNEVQHLTKRYQTHLSNMQKKGEARIPHTIHFIWLGPARFPRQSVANVKDFRKHHPDWNIIFWTDSEQRPLPIPDMQRRLVQNYDFGVWQKLIDCAENYGEESDIMRYVILYNEGGLYADHDATCFASFEGLADRYDFVAACEMVHLHREINTKILPANGLFLSRAGHKVLQKALELTNERWDRASILYPNSPRRRTVYRTFQSFVLASKEYCTGDKDIILPTAYFFANRGFTAETTKRLIDIGITLSTQVANKTWLHNTKEKP